MLKAAALLLILLAVAASAYQVTVEVVDGTTGQILNSIIEILQGNQTVAISGTGLYQGDLPPGTYTALVQIPRWGVTMAQQFSVPTGGPVKIVVPTAILTAEAWDMALDEVGNWPLSIILNGVPIATGVGRVSTEVYANTTTSYVVAVYSPYGTFNRTVFVSQGQNITARVDVPTALIRVALYDEAAGGPANFTVLLINSEGAVAAKGTGEISGEFLAGSYTASSILRLGACQLTYNETVEAKPGARVNETVMVPTAFLYIYAQSPLGAPVKNATVAVYCLGKLALNSSGWPVKAEVLANYNYTVVASYKNLTATAWVIPRAGAVSTVYLNLTVPTAPIKVTPPSPRTTTTTSRTTAAPPLTTTTAKPPSSSGASANRGAPPGEIYAYLLALGGSISIALALGVLLFALYARRA
ncbi:hypothetical protein [Thermoproteus tenax]|uniref:hypothetical protein n=1 Tax=Thermoproteus tenax TaxID=2271 RepID=UPI000699601C|nr:hypothetical protein [Thermoproteus tenax]